MRTSKLRVGCWVIGIILTGSSILQAQGETLPSEREVDVVKWAMTQGGLAVVTLVILWSYRKDSLEWLKTEKERAEAAEERNQQLIHLVIDNTKAMTASTEVQRHLVEELRIQRKGQ